MRSDRVFELEHQLRQKKLTNEELRAQIDFLRTENTALREHEYRIKEDFIIDLKVLCGKINKVLGKYDPLEDIPF